MRFINRKKRYANCFSEISSDPCPKCGYSKNTSPSDAQVLPRGTRLGGKYIVGGVIGRGGFGITYLVFDVRAEKILAVKEYFPADTAVRERKGFAVRPINDKKRDVYIDGLQRFAEESGRVSQFNGNPNIVNVFECFRENNTAYYVMEYLSGITLEKYVEKYGAASLEQCVYLAEKLGLALVAVHSSGLLHRDIAPDNIMLCEDGKIKLLDFGAARKVSEETSLTVMMKTGFTPVEQYSGGVELTAKSDIYALGMTLFYALTGKQPKNVFSRMENDREFADGLRILPASFKNVIEKASAINSAERFNSAADFLNALSDMKICGEVITFSREDFSEDDPIKIDGKSSVPKTRHFIRGLCIGVLLCGALFLPLLIISGIRSEKAETKQKKPPVTIELGGFEKSMSSQYTGRISKNTLEEFDGNVRITLEIETVPYSYNLPEVYLIYPVDSGGASMISYCASESDPPEADITGAIPIERESRKFSLVLTRSGIEALNGGFGFDTYNVAIKSVLLETSEETLHSFDIGAVSLPEDGAAEYSVSFSDNGVKISADFEKYHTTDWDGNMTKYIPQYAFDCFDGDIKLTFQTEYSPKSPKEDQKYQALYMHTFGYIQNHIFEFAETVQIYGEDRSPLIRRTDNLGISPVLSCTEFSVVLPKKIAAKICGGLSFVGDNMTVKHVVVENA